MPPPPGRARRTYYRTIRPSLEGVTPRVAGARRRRGGMSWGAGYQGPRQQSNQDGGVTGRPPGGWAVRVPAPARLVGRRRAARAVPLGERAQGTRVGDGARLGDARLDAHRGQAGAVGEVQVDPRVAGAQIDPEHLAHSSRRRVVRLTTVTPSSSATTLGRLSSTSTPRKSSPVKMKLTRSPGQRRRRSSATTMMTRTAATPTVSSTARVRVGRKVTGRAGRGGTHGLVGRWQVAIRARASQPAGVDVGDEDGPRAQVVELVHDPLGVRARGPWPGRRPSPRRASGRRSATRGPGSARRPARRARRGCRSPSSRSCGPTRTPCEAAQELLDLRPRRVGAAAADDDGLGLAGSARRRSRGPACAAWCRSRRRRR